MWIVVPEVPFPRLSGSQPKSVMDGGNIPPGKAVNQEMPFSNQYKLFGGIFCKNP